MVLDHEKGVHRSLKRQFLGYGIFHKYPRIHYESMVEIYILIGPQEKNN